MTEDHVYQDVVWHRIVLCAIGITQGVLAYVISRPEMQSVDRTLLISFSLFTWSAPVVAVLTVKRDSWAADLLFSLILGFITAMLYKIGIDFLNGGTHFYYFSNYSPKFFLVYAFSFLLLMLIPMPFYQTARREGRFVFPYQQLFSNAWTNILAFKIASFFVCINWLIISLWGSLFKLIGITLFADLFQTTWWRFTFTCAMFALGVALARERVTIIQALLKLILALFRILAPALAAASVLFLISLPFTGLEILWNTKIAAPILLSAIFFTILFQNAAIQTAETVEAFWRPAEWLVMAANIAMPALALLAGWGILLRVDQYGWTPDRSYLMLVTGVAFAYALAYGGSVLVKRQSWADGIIRCNPTLALVVLGLAILIHVPPLQPNSFSAKDQLARLRDGRISPDQFDFAFLKFKLGWAGQQALQTIENDPKLMTNTVIVEGLNRIKTANNYLASRYQAKQKTSMADLHDLATYMDAFPAGQAPPPNAVKFAIKTKAFVFNACHTQPKLNPQRCIYFNVDLNKDGRTDFLIFSKQMNIHIFLQQADSGWTQGPYLTADPKARGQMKLLTALKNADIKLKPHELQDLIIGGVRFK